MESGSQPEREATTPDEASPGESLQSPAFKRPATPPGSRSTQMSGGFTLSKGRLTVHDEEETPKRMRLDRTHLEDGRRSSPGFSFRVGPSSGAAGLSLARHRRMDSLAPAVRGCSGEGAVVVRRCGPASQIIPLCPRTGSTASPDDPPASAASAANPAPPASAATPVVGPESALWSRTLHQVQQGRGQSPFSAYVDSLTPLQNGAKSQATGMMQKHSQLLPSPIEGIQPLALTPADETPGQVRTPTEGESTEEHGTYGESSAAAASPERVGHSPGSEGGGRILALDSAFKNHGPRKLQMPRQDGHSATADMVERIVSGLDQPISGLEHSDSGIRLDQMMFGADDDSVANQMSLQALFDDGSINSLINKSEQPVKKSKSRQGKPKKCNCKNSKCLKLYCDCFSAGNYCQDCNCTDCLNTKENETGREEARQSVLKRNPRAFNPKFKAIESPSQVAASTRHVKGCNCKNSRCQKNYCECFQARQRQPTPSPYTPCLAPAGHRDPPIPAQMGVECTSKCKCENCLNGKDCGDADAADGELAGELDAFPDAHILLDGVQQELKTDAPRHYATGGVGSAGARDTFHGRELLEMHSLMCSEDLPEAGGAQPTLQVTSIEVLPAQYGITPAH